MPITARVSLVGMPQVRKALARVSGALQGEATVNGLDKATDPIVETMVQLSPKDTTALSLSIGKRLRTYRRGRVILAAIGPRNRFSRFNRKPSRYAHMQELGTVHHAAQPYIRPAWDAHSGGFPSRLATEIARGLK